MEIEELQNQIRAFAQERDWTQFHSVRNLILALVGEVGELAETVQWLGEVTPDAIADDVSLSERFAHEIADVLIYLLRLADVAGLDLSQAVTSKLELNAIKYPANEVRGSAEKR